MKQRAVYLEKTGDLTIIKGDKVYHLPAGWEISGSGSVEWRNKLEDRAFSHGSSMTGDGKVKGRKIEIEFYVMSPTVKTHEEVVNEAYIYFAQTDYDLYSSREDRLYHVAGIASIKHKYQKGFKGRFSDITVTLLLADPFRYESVASTDTFLFSEMVNAQEIVIDNKGSADTPLIFTFTPENNMSSITMYHVELEEQMVITDALLTAPATLTVNGKVGTVWRDSNNAINSFSGQFLYAKPGINHFLYSGSAGRIDITYTNRWYV